MARPAPREFVFAYGSLVGETPEPPTRAFDLTGFVVDLRGLCRRWGVAMNNRVDLPGYKCYLDDAGARPHVHVAFLDLTLDRHLSVNGVCLPVTSERLAELDRRERSYRRRDLTAHLDPPRPGVRVWGYLGAPAARARLTRARRHGRAAIDESYLKLVRAAFARLGSTEYVTALPSLDPDGLPVLALHRCELP